ncbi:unnamed protein product [Colias eurytheme]|nr:unnamed protein product [Colias eurytheme]
MKMSYLPLLGVLLLAGLSQSETPNTRIVGGRDTTIENYPSLVQVEYFDPGSGFWHQDCAANILTTYWVLTAAQCNEYTRDEYTRIRAGATYRETNGSVHYVDFSRNHPDYIHLYSYDADIGLMKLLTPLVYSPYIQKATIVNQGFVVPDNYPVVHAGWGDIYTNGPQSEVLQSVTVYTVNTQVCEWRWGHGLSSPITKNMICAGVLEEGGRDACHGDSGGPMYIGDVIVGIISFRYENCADAFTPGISTSVASYSDWIVSNTR